MHIGLVTTIDADDPTSISGMVYSIKQQLSRFATVTSVLPDFLPSPSDRWRRRIRSFARQYIPEGLRSAIRSLVTRTPGTQEQPAVCGHDSVEAIKSRSAALSQLVAQRLVGADYDLLFCPCVSKPIYLLDTSIPIVYFADLTSYLLSRTYHNFERKGEEWTRGWDEVERDALHRCAAVTFPSTYGTQSAVDHYGVDPRRVHVVPMGANVLPRRPPRPIDPPSKSDLRLCTVVSDIIRKQLGLIIEATTLLRQGGWAATLTYVGQATPDADRLAYVHCLGVKSLSLPKDRRALMDLYESSHLLVLPSLGEAFGIAPCEAAHFGKPSVVSDVGGLPDVVKDGQTGIVLPLSAGPRDYADAISGMCNDLDRYARMCQSAKARAESVLSWDAWGNTMQGIIRGVLSDRGSPVQGADRELSWNG